MPSKETLSRLRRAGLVLWLAIVAAGGYAFFFHPALVDAQLRGAFSESLGAASAAYLLLGALRGFTLLPSTTLVLAAVPFFRPWPLLGLTLGGILVSSVSIYFFAESLHLDELVARRHPQRVATLKAALEKYELPVIIGWSFFPLAPTDLIVYVCGVLRVDVKTCLLGVLIGEGAICAIYIFGGDWLLRAVHFRS
jgi:uncharacterized membrane protein YdjX (TVP38/TMEM64 family)